MELKGGGDPASTTALYTRPIKVTQPSITMGTRQLPLQCTFFNWVTNNNHQTCKSCLDPCQKLRDIYKMNIRFQYEKEASPLQTQENKMETWQLLIVNNVLNHYASKLDISSETIEPLHFEQLQVTFYLPFSLKACIATAINGKQVIASN